MTSYHRALAVLVVAVLGIWGCTQGPGSNAEKVKNLESKANRLEEDLRAATAARDQFKKKLSEAENLTAQQRQDLEDLRGQVKARTAERDTLSQQFEGFRKNLKELIGQTEAALAKPPVRPVNTVSQPKVPNL
jgi:septal ring factor EnvC (AmiA/AmiB activator)